MVQQMLDLGASGPGDDRVDHEAEVEPQHENREVQAREVHSPLTYFNHFTSFFLKKSNI